MSSVSELASSVKNAAPALCALSTEQKNAALHSMARALVNGTERITSANAEDIRAASDKPDSFRDRLLFDAPRIKQSAEGLEKVAELDDPVGVALDKRTLASGISLVKVTAPLGVIAVIYEARPNVTVDAAGLCIKSSSAALLRGSRDAVNTNRAVVGLLKEALASCGIDPSVIALAECDRAGVTELLSLAQYVDLVIPRGSKSLIDFVRQTATVPVIETGAGNCSAYIDDTADISLAKQVILNAKTSRVSVCNALESLYIKDTAVERSLPVLEALVGAGVTIHADKTICGYFEKAVPASEDDWYREYLSLDISAKTVKGVEDAVKCVNKYGTHHSDVILSKDKKSIEYFYKNVDSAVVYSNASTRFTDGFCFGKGAEMGISTQKLHARGPMGLGEMVTYKYIVRGDGQIRE